MSTALLAPHLTTQLTHLTDAQKTITTLINRLARLPSHLGTTPSSAPKDGVRLELSAEIHQRLKEQADALELLRQEVEDLPLPTRSSGRDESDRARLDIGLSRLTEDLKTARSSFRRAQLLAKRALDASRRDERALLVTTLSYPPTSSTASSLPPSPHHPLPPPTPTLTQSDLELSATQDVTASLRRTHALLSSELSRSEFAHATLVESTAALTQLQTSYSSLSALLASSRTLLGTLLRSQKSDTWYLESALYILLSTVVWLVFRRLLYGPLWWFAYLPLKLVVRSVWAVAGFVPGLGLASTTASLTVQSSATGAFGTWDMAENKPTVAVGRAGREGGKAPDTHTDTPLMESVGQMAEATHKEEVQPNRQANPKKRMWEEGAERERYERQMEEAKAEVEERQQKAREAQDQSKAKDEL